MATKKIAVCIKYNGIIPLLSCYGPIKRVVLPEADVETIKKILGPEYVQVLTPKKPSVEVKKPVVKPVIEPEKEVVVEETKEEKIVETIEEIQETVTEEISTEVKEEPKRRGRRPTTTKEVG